MHLHTLEVSNFRGICNIRLEHLGSAVVLAGPNGCGKSCILDAIRLLKSAYGSYEQDEINMWLGEFQINAQRPSSELIGLLQDKNKPLEISGEFNISKHERDFLINPATLLIEEIYWRKYQPGSYRPKRYSVVENPQAHQQQLEEAKNELIPEIEKLKSTKSLKGRLVISPQGEIRAIPNKILGLLFSTYMPQKIGVIDYHGPHRTYARSRTDSVNLQLEASETQQRQHALYNSTNKYANLKTEMTSAYVRHLISQKANPDASENDHLTTTLKELFSTFFPGKEFLGPQPSKSGNLTFPVRLSNGALHDIDELSSGEKEVVYGYLRLSSTAPLNSMIMIDEPELHLNPRLVSGLAAFYYRHLGAKFGNQLWLVTHSDTLIREAVNHPSFDVFHIQPPEKEITTQATPVKAQGDLENVVLALVGDLAAYRPGQKVVIFESTEDSAFDLQMTCKLFPAFEQHVNAISAGNKKRVLDLYELLEIARIKGRLDTRFFAVSDADSDDLSSPNQSTKFFWDAYHIENYLLQPSFILKSLHILGSGKNLKNEMDVLDDLKDCASETINELVAHKLSEDVNKKIIGTLKLRFDPKRNDISIALKESIERSQKTTEELISKEFNSEQLLSAQKRHEKEFQIALENDTWSSIFRGRDLLKRFVGRHGNGIPYVLFRNHILNTMAENQYQPIGMGRIVNKILSA